MTEAIDVQIKGVSPLLQHKYPDQQEITSKVRSKRVSSEDYSSEELKYLHKDAKGRICEPASHIEGSMIKAASEFFIKGHKGKRYTERVKAFVRVEPDLILHKNQEWHVDSRSVVIQRQRVMRRRPCFPDWALGFRVVISDGDSLNPETLHEILEYAGRNIGIGDYRPRFGRFEITAWKVQE